MQEFTVDYNRVGRSETARVAVWPQQRGHIAVGQSVLVRGDDVPERTAVVESISDDGKYAMLRFRGDVDGAPPPRTRRLTVPGLPVGAISR